jgi:triosephosphate isomerase
MTLPKRVTWPNSASSSPVTTAISTSGKALSAASTSSRETLAEREAGTTSTVVLRQFDAVASRLGEKVAAIVIAYEPVWAIGTGLTASPDQAQMVHGMLRARLAGAAQAVPLLYGGSVKADNAKALFACPDIDGALVGGASLKADEFLAIARA